MERFLWKDGDFRALLKSLRETSNLAEAKKGKRGDTSGVPDAFDSRSLRFSLSEKVVPNLLHDICSWTMGILTYELSTPESPLRFQTSK